jgi:ferredoxin
MGTKQLNTSQNETSFEIICPSTRAFWEESRRLQSHSFIDFLHGYFYSRWPYLYIGVASGEHWMAKVIKALAKWRSAVFPTNSGSNNEKTRAAEKYHAKVLTNESARRLVMVEEDVRLENLEKIIPYRQARDLILTDPDHIVVIDCPCRSSRTNPCSPLQVCLIVGEPFAGFIIEHHPERARRIDQEETCDILRASHSRGHVHHAFFNEPMLNRFFGICNCCPCCCVAMQAMRRGIPMIASSGYMSEVDVDLCVGCGDCLGSCPFGALRCKDEIVVVDGDGCMGCGVCVSVCEVGALSLIRDPTKSEPLEIEDLIKENGHKIGKAA